MQINSLTVGPIVGATTGTAVRLWGRGKLEKLASGPRRCFGVARIWEADEPPGGDPLYFKMNPNFDMTGIAIFDGLKSETDYNYQMAWFFSDRELDELNNSATIVPDWDDAQVYTTRTGSNRKTRQRSFIFGSCRYLLRLFGGLWTDSRGDKTFGSILKQIEQDGRRTDQILMIGDQIYADDLNILHNDETLDAYNARYRQAFSQPNIQRLMSRVPTYMTLDDHEIEDNWPADSSQRDWTIKYPAAMHAYQTYQISHSPVFSTSGNRIVGTPERFWYQFTDGCADFFVTDTRTERFLPNDLQEKEIMSDKQMDALKAWLEDGSGRVKFLASSVPVFPESRMSNEDKWGGFPSQRSELLDFIWEKRIPRVVMLSGDVHSSFSLELMKEGDNSGFKVIGVTSSAYYWPYPHNSRFAFRLNGNIQTENNVFQVKNASKVWPTDNFTRLTVSQIRLKVEVFGRKGHLLDTRTFLL